MILIIVLYMTCLVFISVNEKNCKDVSSLRPLCLGIVSAVAQTATRMRENLMVQRMAVLALSSMAYVHDVAALVSPLALPVVIEAALAFPDDTKLQANACEERSESSPKVC